MAATQADTLLKILTQANAATPKTGFSTANANVTISYSNNNSVIAVSGILPLTSTYDATLNRIEMTAQDCFDGVVAADLFEAISKASESTLKDTYTGYGINLTISNSNTVATFSGVIPGSSVWDDTEKVYAILAQDFLNDFV